MAVVVLAGKDIDVRRAPARAIELRAEQTILPCTDGCVSDRKYWTKNNKYDDSAPWPNVACPDVHENLEDLPLYETKYNYFHFMELSPKINKCVETGQYIIMTHINKCAGACVPDEVAGAIIEFESLFRDHCPDAEPNAPLPDNFISKSRLLGAYNAGEYGPGKCNVKNRALPVEVAVADTELDAAQISSNTAEQLAIVAIIMASMLSVLFIICVVVGIISLVWDRKDKSAHGE